MFEELIQESGLSIERLRNFCQIAHAGGITRAADGNPVTQSLYSRQLKELEEYFGVELVRRKGRGIVLTSAGEKLNALACESLGMLRDFRNGCKGQAQELSIAAGESLIRWLLIPSLSRFKKNIFNTVFRFHNYETARIADCVAGGVVDFGLIRSDALPPSCKSVALGTMKHSLFIPKRMFHTSKDKKAVSIQVLDGLPLATLDGEGAFKTALVNAFKEQMLSLKIEIECSSFPLIAEVVSTGNAAAILPSIASTEVCSDQVSEIQLAFLDRFDRKILLAWNERVVRIRPIMAKAKRVLNQELKF